MTNTEWLRSRITDQLNITEVGDKTESLESLRDTEWSKEFEEHMRVRLIMGRFRYGLFNRDSGLNYDRVSSIITRMESYKQTGNLEFLVDVANLCLVEFEHGDHPDKHFNSVDDGVHTKQLEN